MYAPTTKILVVDDMVTMRKIVLKACKTLGFTNFVEAGDGQQAWEALNANPDVGFIIADWNMPNCSGLDLLKRLRADLRFKALPFILLTAENEAEQVVEARKAGVDGYVVKPFSAEVLGAKMVEIHGKKGQAA